MSCRASTQAKLLTIAFSLLLGFLLGNNITSSAHSASYYIPKTWESDPYYYF